MRFGTAGKNETHFLRHRIHASDDGRSVGRFRSQNCVWRRHLDRSGLFWAQLDENLRNNSTPAWALHTQQTVYGQVTLGLLSPSWNYLRALLIWTLHGLLIMWLVTCPDQKLNARSKGGGEEKPQIELRPIWSEDEKALIGRGRRKRKRKKPTTKQSFANRLLTRDASFRSSGNEKGRKKEMGEIYSGEKEQVGQRPS